MKFTETPLAGAYVIEPERLDDDRGFFARTFCVNEFSEHDLDTGLVQCSISFNKKQGTIRGMHYQEKPHEEAKIVRCTAGSIFDVIVDIRHRSGTFRKWFALELTADNRCMLYIPAGFAHGFMTLEDNTEVCYQMTEMYHPECARGIRWNDPAIDIEWPREAAVVSDRDRNYPDFGA